VSVPWPDGARCAVCISWDVDADSLVLHRLRDRGFQLYGGLSWLRYDEVAVPKIVETLARYGLTQTFCVTGWCIERYPAMCEAILAGGHEIAHHGYLHEATGSRPTGWRAPYASLSSRSADFLVQQGFLYDSSLMNDSTPYVIQAAGGELIELPIDGTMSDWPHYAHVPDLGYLQSPKAPEAAMEVYRAEFDAAWELGGLWISIWHPHVSGRPARLLAWARLVEYMQERGGVWFATLDQIARHVRTCVDDGSFEPRTVSLPWYEAPPVEFERSGG